MALLGILSLAQIWFIPGYLVLQPMRNVNPIDKMLLAVPISAVFNFFVVYLLVLLNLYNQSVVITLFIIEMLFLFYLKQIHKPQNGHASQFTANKIIISINFTNIIFGLLTVICFSQFLYQFGTVFTQGDAVFSWNHWAISWYDGKIPNGIAWYPQLLPTLYSITYKFIDNSQVELFAKVAVSIYPLIVIALFLRIAVLLPSERNKILWSGIIFFALVRRLWGSESNLNGYADFPLTLFSVSIFYAFVLAAIQKKELHSQFSLTIPAILIYLAIGAGLMKQSGVYLGVLVPFVWLVYFQNHCNRPKHIKHSILMGLLIASGYCTWYFYQYYRMSIGVEESNLKQLASIVSLPWYESVVYGFKGITKKLSWLWIAVFISSVFNSKMRYLSLVVVTPFILLWAAFVPYDYRNLAPVFPFFAMSLTYGWVKLTEQSKEILNITKIKSAHLQKGFIFLILAGISIALLNPKYKNELLQISSSAKKQIGYPEINHLLLAYFELHPEPSLLATPYADISKIPQLSERFQPLQCQFIKRSNVDESDMEPLISRLNNSSIKLIMITPWCDSAVINYFSNHPEKYSVIFRHDGFILFKISDSNI